MASPSLHAKIAENKRIPSFLSRDSNEIERRKDDKDLSNDELSLGKIPDQHEILKASPVMKLCQEEWQPRCISLTGTLDFFEK
jgi:hypothetical protein